MNANNYLLTLLVCCSFMLYIDGKRKQVSTGTQACVGKEGKCEVIIGGPGKKTAVVDCSQTGTKCKAIIN